MVAIVIGIVLIVHPRLFWRQQPRWYNTSMIQLLWPKYYDLITRSLGAVLIIIGWLNID